MTTTAMTCALFNDRLMAYLERETDEPTRAALERHAVTCVDCGALLADLRKLRIEAANLPELTPSRDLWSGIASRIETPVVPITGEWRVAQRRAPARRWMRTGLMAASLVAAASVGYVFATARRGPSAVAQVAKVDTVVRTVPGAPDTVMVPAPAAQVASNASNTSTTAAPAAVRGTPNASTDVRRITEVIAPAPAAVRAYTTLVADYDREIARLRTLINQRRNQMDPVTVAVIEKNLQVIDAAIEECKKAIARDPASRFLMESLNQSLQAKVELMRTAALLPSRT
ncbi:MAG TPA: zf-HC2 domain-containing protein [Gemmatimonadaceae bacterium]|nr:zf-HC2 domain-containing protein [Gemmatimonadaceae bacterium]